MCLPRVEFQATALAKVSPGRRPGSRPTRPQGGRDVIVLALVSGAILCAGGDVFPTLAETTLPVRQARSLVLRKELGNNESETPPSLPGPLDKQTPRIAAPAQAGATIPTMS